MKKSSAIVFLALATVCGPAWADPDVDDIDRETLVQLVLESNGGEPCSHYGWCERHGYDNGDSVVDEATARIIVDAAYELGAEFDVPVLHILAIAWKESHFYPLALGSDTECGMFQQSAELVHADPDDNWWPASITTPPMTWREQCDALLDPYTATYVFVHAYHHRATQRGSSYGWDRGWACYYHGGRTCTADEQVYEHEIEIIYRWFRRVVRDRREEVEDAEG